MKKKKIIFIAAMLVVAMITAFNCSKLDSNEDCGCNAYNYVIVKNEKGLLVYQNNIWYLVNDSTQFPFFTGIIYNQDSKIIKDFTTTATNDSIPVLFSGKRTQACIEDKKNLPQVMSADRVVFNITIDSLKNN
jgi:hypothetical protein